MQKKHGIALWQVVDSYIKHISAAASEEYLQMMKARFLIDQFLPKYFCLERDCSVDYPYKEIYPTEKMYAEARRKAREVYFRSKT